MAKKKTNFEMFELVKVVCADNLEIVNWCNERQELLLKKKASNSNSKTNQENEKLAEIVLNELQMFGKAVTVSDMLENSQVIKDYVLENGKHISNQKLTHILYALVDNKKAVQVTSKKKSYFSPVEE